MFKKLAIILMLLMLPIQALANDNLVASTFQCRIATYTFFPDTMYSYTISSRSWSKEIKTLSYSYNGSELILRYVDINGRDRETRYDVTYVKSKGKLILKNERITEICVEY